MKLKEVAVMAALTTALTTPLAFSQTQPSGQGTQGKMFFQQEQSTSQSAQGQGQGAQLYLSPATVRQIQQQLNDAGFHAGNVDGNWGPESQKAIRAFQQARGLEMTGNIDFMTLKELGILQSVLRAEAQSGQGNMPSQQEKAQGGAAQGSQAQQTQGTGGQGSQAQQKQGGQQ